MLQHRKKEATIHEAAKQGEVEQIQRILSEDPHAYLIRNANNVLAISVAASQCRTEAVTCFLQHATKHGYQYSVHDALVWFRGSVKHDHSFRLLIEIIQENRSVFSDQLPESHFQAIIGNQQYFESDSARWYETNDMGITAAFFNIILGYGHQRTLTKEIIVTPTKDLTDNEKRELSLYCYTLAIFYRRQGNSDEKTYILKAMALLEQIKDPQDFDYRVLVTMQLSLQESRWDQSLSYTNTGAEHIQKAIDLIEKIKDKQDVDWRNLSACHLRSANYYKQIREDKLAKRRFDPTMHYDVQLEYKNEEMHLLKAIALHENKENQQDTTWRQLGFFHSHLAECYCSQGRNENEEEQLLKAVASCEKIGRMTDLDWENLQMCQTKLAEHYKTRSKNEMAKEMAEVFFRKAIMSIDKIKDENKKALWQLHSFSVLATYLINIMDKDLEGAQLILEALKIRNSLLAKKVKIEKPINLIAYIKIIIRKMLDNGMFDEAAPLFMGFMGIYYLCADVNNQSKTSMNADGNAKDFSFVNGYCTALIKYQSQSIYVYKQTFAYLLDLMARMFRTVEEDNLPKLWSEILILLNNDIYQTHSSIRSALILFCKLLRFTIEHAQDEGSREIINPAIQSACDTKDKKANILKLVKNLEKKCHADFNLSDHIVCSVLNQNAALKNDNEALMRELIELKKEKEDRSTVTKHVFFSQDPKRERDDPEEELQREDEQNKRIKSEPSQDANSSEDKGAEPVAKK